MAGNALAQRRYAERRLTEDADGYRAERNQIRARWQRRNQAKHNAHNVVYRAIRSGRLVRPDTCQHCHIECKPEASHDDYTRPLVVEWLCRQCHADKDRKD